MKNLQFTDVGKEITAGKEGDFEKVFNSLEYQNLPCKDFPFSQGYAIKEIIKEWQMPAKAVAYGQHGRYMIYGIRTLKQTIYFADDGDITVTPLALADN